MSGSTASALLTDAIKALVERGLLARDLVDLEITEETDLSGLGLDSLAVMNLLSEIEERADLCLSERDVAGLRSVRDLARLLERRVGR